MQQKVPNMPDKDIKTEKDFIEQYKEIMELLRRDMHTIEKDWRENGGQIKKFTLLKNSPTPVLSDHTNPTNF